MAADVFGSGLIAAIFHEVGKQPSSEHCLRIWQSGLLDKSFLQSKTAPVLVYGVYPRCPLIL